MLCNLIRDVLILKRNVNEGNCESSFCGNDKYI